MSDLILETIEAVTDIRNERDKLLQQLKQVTQERDEMRECLIAIRGDENGHGDIDLAEEYLEKTKDQGD